MMSLHEVSKFVKRRCFYLRELAVSFFLGVPARFFIFLINFVKKVPLLMTFGRGQRKQHLLLHGGPPLRGQGVAMQDILRHWLD